MTVKKIGRSNRSRTRTISKRAHVIKRDTGWAVKKEGNTKATKIYKTQDDAVKGAQYLRLKGHDVIIHESDGSIRDWQKKSK